MKFSDQQLFSSVLEDASPFDAVCPCCGAKGCCVPHASYSRVMITLHAGTRTEISVCVPRLRCTSCGHTHALLPDVLIPFGSYTLRFVLNVLYGYLSRAGSVADFCDSRQISVSTLYGWIHLFEDQASLILGVLKKAAHLSMDALTRICMEPDLPGRFFSACNFSFLQVHKTSRSGP